MNICVFCSAADVDKKYVDAAHEFASLIAKNGHSLVWGGSDKGLMKVVASCVQENGGKIIGVSMELLRKSAREGADVMIIAKDLNHRKAVMIERADAFVALVGGTGTLDEVIEVLELKTLGEHKKPIVFLNTDGFYDGLKGQFDKMGVGGFLHQPMDGLIRFINTPLEAIEYIESHGK